MHGMGNLTNWPEAKCNVDHNNNCWSWIYIRHDVRSTITGSSQVLKTRQSKEISKITQLPFGNQLSIPKPLLDLPILNVHRIIPPISLNLLESPVPALITHSIKIDPCHSAHSTLLDATKIDVDSRQNPASPRLLVALAELAVDLARDGSSVLGNIRDVSVLSPGCRQRGGGPLLRFEANKQRSCFLWPTWFCFWLLPSASWRLAYPPLGAKFHDGNFQETHSEVNPGELGRINRQWVVYFSFFGKSVCCLAMTQGLLAMIELHCRQSDKILYSFALLIPNTFLDTYLQWRLRCHFTICQNCVPNDGNIG